MTFTHVAFLRGINLGARRVTNDRLLGAFATAGVRDASAYQAAGNVVFACPQGLSTADLERTLLADLGYEVMTTIRSDLDMREVSNAAPFTDIELASSTGKPQVILCDQVVPEQDWTSIELLAPPGDRFVRGHREIFWLPSGGLSDTTLRMRDLEKFCGTVTVRTKGTIDRIASKFFAE